MAEQPFSVLAMLTEFFSAEQIEATARRTGFVRRTSKITGQLFRALVTFGSWSDAMPTLAPLVAKATQLSGQVAVSPAALYQRLIAREPRPGTKRAAERGDGRAAPGHRAAFGGARARPGATLHPSAPVPVPE